MIWLCQVMYLIKIMKFSTISISFIQNLINYAPLSIKKMMTFLLKLFIIEDIIFFSQI